MLASAQTLIEASVSPTQAAMQLGPGRSTLNRELAVLRQIAPTTPMLDTPAKDTEQI